MVHIWNNNVSVLSCWPYNVNNIQNRKKKVFCWRILYASEYTKQVIQQVTSLRKALQIKLTL